MKLYEISETRLNFLQAIESGDIPEEAISDTLSAIDGEFDEKADDIACFIKSLMYESVTLKSEADKLIERSQSKKNKAERLTEYLYNQFKLCEKNKLETSRNLLQIRKTPPKVEVLDENAFVTWAKKTKKDLLTVKEPVPNKTKIKEFYQDQVKANPEYSSKYFSVLSGEKLSIK